MQPSTEIGELEPIEWAGYDDPLLFRECFIALLLLAPHSAMEQFLGS